MSKTYSESGRARKVCPECGLYCHARSLNCPNCDHKFKERKVNTKEKTEKQPRQPVDKKEPTIYNNAGRGRKKCSNCNIYVSVRLKDCPKCGSQIVKLPKPEKVVKVKDATITKSKPSLPEDNGKKHVGKLVFAPAGKPPFDPDENVETWCSNVFTDGLKNEITYSNQALWYWYQQYNNDPENRTRIWEWSKREGFDKMQECSKEPIPSTEETETDTLQLSNQEE